MKTVSVIVPVYNQPEYVKTCIQSVLQQTYQELEILIIDDGSEKETADLCDEFAQQDKRITVIHKENGGVATARNTGIENATGEYITFVDGDDWVEPAFVQTLVEVLEESNADIAQINHIFEFVSGSELNAAFVEHESAHIPVTEYHQRMLSEYRLDVQMFVWRCLFKKEAIGDIRFPEGDLIEDVLFLLQLWTNEALTICTVNAPLYHYMHRQTSTTNSDRFDTKIQHTVEWLRRQKELLAIESVQQHLSILCFLPLYRHRKRMFQQMNAVQIVQSLQPDYEAFAPSGKRAALLRANLLIGAYIDYVFYSITGK